MALKPIIAVMLNDASFPGTSCLVPGCAVVNYEDLEAVAFAEFNYPPDIFDVHFHLRPTDFATESCAGKLVSFLWTNGSYASAGFGDNGADVQVWAHFGLRMMPAPPVDSVMQEITNMPFLGSPFLSVSTVEFGSGPSSPEATTPTRTTPRETRKTLVKAPKGKTLKKGAKAKKGGKKSTKKPKKAAKVKKSPVQRPVEYTRTRSGARKTVVRESSPAAVAVGDYPPLPFEATPENWLADRDFARANNAPVDDPRHRPDFANLALRFKRRIGHARLIDGIYGVVANNACRKCILSGENCRVYHPGVRTLEFARVNSRIPIGKACARCNFNGLAACCAS